MTTPNPYGAASQTPVAPPEPARDPGRWAVLVAAMLFSIGAAALVLIGLALVAQDLSDRGEMFDGLGLFLGLLVGALGLVLAGAAWMFWSLSRRRVTLAGWLLSAGGGLAVLFSAAIMLQGHREDAVPWGAGGLVFLALGLWAALAGRPAERGPGGPAEQAAPTSVDSPGGRPL